MEAVKLFISLPFQKDGTEEAFPGRLRAFRAPELNRYLDALRREIRSAAEGMEDTEVSALEFGFGSFCHIPPDDLAALYSLIGSCFRLKPGLRVTLNATPRGFDFYRLNAARQAGEAQIRFLTPCVQDEGLRAAGFGTAEELLGALDVCFQAGYHRFVCELSPACHPTAAALADSLGKLLQKRPEGFTFDAQLTPEQRETAARLLCPSYVERPEGFFLPRAVPVEPEEDQLGCGLGAVTRFGGAAVRNTTDFDFYCEHAEDFELIAKPIEE